MEAVIHLQIKSQSGRHYQEPTGTATLTHAYNLPCACISTGEFHFPNDEAAEIAVDTVTAFLKEHGEEFDRVIFNVFKEQDKELYQAQFE